MAYEGLYELNTDLEYLKKDVNEFIERQQLQARISERIHTFTAMCWDKYALPQQCYVQP